MFLMSEDRNCAKREREREEKGICSALLVMDEEIELSRESLRIGGASVALRVARLGS